MTILSTLTNIISGAKGALAKVHDATAGLRSQYDQAIADRQQLFAARAPRADVLQVAADAVDARGAAWRKAHAAELVARASGGVNDDAAYTVRAGGLPDPFGPDPLTGVITFDTICGLAPQLVKDAMRGMIDAFEYDAGPAMVKRPALIADLDQRIADIEREHARLVDDAADANITLAHLPSEIARRRQAADRAARIARDLRDNQRYYAAHPEEHPDEVTQ